MKLLYILYAFVLRTIHVICDDWNPAGDCLDGITTDITSFVFGDVEAGSYYATMCNGTLSTTSMWLAAKLYCSSHEIEVGEKIVAGWCTEYGETTLIPYAEVEPKLTDEFIASLPVVSYEDIAVAQTWNTAVVISKDLFVAGFKTSRVWNMEMQAHHRYGWAIFGFWGGVILIGVMNHICHQFLISRQVGRTPDEKAYDPSPTKFKLPSPIQRIVSKLSGWFRANLIIPATFGTRHRRPVLLCTIPTRVESLVISLFWIINIAICCATYELFFPNLYYTKAFQAWRYISDRTGIICFYNLPWLWIFAGRNNVLIWLTGWSFQTFNIFHRHIARIAVVQAIVHSIGYSVLEANFHELASSWKENYWYMGGISTISMSLLLVLSSMFFRQRSYELFLLLHIGFSVLTLVGLFYHVAIFDGEYNPYLWPLVAIWGFDRAARLFRWVYCNLNIRLCGDLRWSTAVASYDSDADLIRLHVMPGSDLLKPGAGQHYFLYHFRQLLGWENHPFTLATFNDKPMTEIAANHIEIDSQAKMAPVVNKELSSSETSSQLEGQNAESTKTMTFLIRPYAGWTRRLKDQCHGSDSGSVSFDICIEGPYGHKAPLHTFERVLFIVGGTGISSALPYLQEYLEGISSTGRRIVTRNVKLVWAAKQAQMLRSIAERELGSLRGRTDVDICLHCTSSDAIPPLKENAAMTATVEPSLVFGRPDVARCVADFVETTCGADSLSGKIAVLACGPAELADDARAGVHGALKQGRTSVEYFEESFGW